MHAAPATRSVRSAYLLLTLSSLAFGGTWVAAALAAIVLRERTGRWAIAGFAAAFLGLLLVVRPGGTQAGDRLIGDLLFLASAVCWAFYALIGRAATRRFTPVGATLYATVTATILLLPLAILEHGWGTLLHAPSAAVIGLLYLAIVGTVVSFVFLFEGINRIGVTRRLVRAADSDLWRRPRRAFARRTRLRHNGGRRCARAPRPLAGAADSGSVSAS